MNTVKTSYGIINLDHLARVWWQGQKLILRHSHPAKADLALQGQEAKTFWIWYSNLILFDTGADNENQR